MLFDHSRPFVEVGVIVPHTNRRF